MPDSESGPWESHPRRVLRQLRREVSLCPVPVMASPGAARLFPHGRYSLAFHEGSWRICVVGLVLPDTGNVSDEWVFSC